MSDLQAKASKKARHFLEVREVETFGKWMDMDCVACDHELPPEKAERDQRITRVLDEVTCSACVEIILRRGMPVRGHKPINGRGMF